MEHDASIGEADTRSQYLTLTVGAERFAVSLGAVLEILQVGVLTPLPMTPPFVRGVMNLRGAVVPVLDLNARFGRARAVPSRRSCIVIVQVDSGEGEAGTQPMGLLVDAVQEVLAVADDDLEPVPPIGNRIAPDLLAGIARVRGALCPVLALDRVLDTPLLARLIAEHDRDAVSVHGAFQGAASRVAH
ncbi:MAG: chemotaxis protein CheW [Lautropia sp.]